MSFEISLINLAIGLAVILVGWLTKDSRGPLELKIRAMAKGALILGVLMVLWGLWGLLALFILPQ